jgi:hypothetical protein
MVLEHSVMHVVYVSLECVNRKERETNVGFTDYSKLLRKGSLTVQTHNYLLDTPSEKKMPRIIQFPIIQVQANKDHTHNDKMMTTHHNNNNNNNSSSSTSTSSSSHMNNNRRLIDLIDDNQKEHQ